jgi:hypothetical protein
MDKNPSHRSHVVRTITPAWSWYYNIAACRRKAVSKTSKFPGCPCHFYGRIPGLFQEIQLHYTTAEGQSALIFTSIDLTGTRLRHYVSHPKLL